MSLAPLRSAIVSANCRTFSTTPWALHVSPESPSYIEIPRPPQVRSFLPPRNKGKLPHPKKLPQNLDAATATPDPPLRPQEPITDISEDTKAYIKWKGNLASSRRRNLREGLAELQKRQKEQEDRCIEVLSKRSEEREALLNAKQREDVRLTLPSVLSTLRHDDGSKMIRTTPERLAEKSALREAKEAAKAEARIEHFHELYLNARNFILTEKQLDEAIEKEFVQNDQFVKTLPPTVEDMLLQVANSHGNFSKDPKMLEIAGQLTGAKLMPEKVKRDSSVFGLETEEGHGLVNRSLR